MLLEYCEQPNEYSEIVSTLIETSPINCLNDVNDGEIYLKYIYFGF